MSGQNYNLDLSFEGLLLMDIPSEIKSLILNHALKDRMLDDLLTYAGSIVLKSVDLQNVGVSAKNIKILRLINEII